MCSSDLIPYMEKWLSALVADTELRSTSRQTYAWMQARMALSQADFGRALSIINKAIALDPSHVLSHQHLAAVFMASGKFDQAAAKLEELKPMTRTSRDRAHLIELHKELERRRAS